MAPVLQVEDVGIRAGDRMVQQHLNFCVRRGEVMAVVGPSGCGKSTLLRHMAGLEQPFSGRITYEGDNIHQCGPQRLAQIRQSIGMVFQSGALWSSMRVGDNLALPLQLFSRLPADEIAQRVLFNLGLVRLGHAHDLMPAQLSGGMRKRVAFARALMLEPSVLLLDEPGSGLDAISAALLDEIILHLKRDRGVTTVMVTHENTSVFRVADQVVFLDSQAQTMTAMGTPAELLVHGPAEVRQFLTRGVFI